VESPKDQYLLLRALDEVLASLLTLPDGSARLHEATGDKVSLRHHLMQFSISAGNEALVIAPGQLEVSARHPCCVLQQSHRAE